jgi:Phosphatidylethanolamine-binding protein
MDAWVLRGLIRGIPLVIAAAGSSGAFAQVGPSTPQGFAVDQVVSNSNGTQESTGNGAFVDDGVAKATAIYTGNDGSASLSIAPGSSDFEIAHATTTWFFTVLGPPEISSIPLLFTGKGSLSIENATAANYGLMDQATVTSTIPGFSIGQSVGANQQTFFNINSFANVVDNFTYQVNLGVSAYSFGGKTAAIKGSIDPFIQFAPGFNSNGFSIVSSPVSAVPEPPVWLMVSVGLGIILFAGRRKSKGFSRLSLASDLGEDAYHGPCPAQGDPPHRYTFTIYALNVAKLPVPADSSGGMVTSIVQE